MPRIDTLVKLCAALGVRIDCALLDGITWNEGGATATPGEFRFRSRSERKAELLERAAALRERQPQTSDAVELVREGREELERRGSPDEPEAG